MKEHLSLTDAAQRMVAEILETDKWFAAHRVTIIRQNSEELAFMLKRKIESIEGPVLIVGVDSVANNRPAAEVTVAVTVTEVVPTNRARQGFATAIETAEAAIDDLDGADWHWAEDLRHETPNEGSGILVARTTFKAMLSRPGYDTDDNDAAAVDGNG